MSTLGRGGPLFATWSVGVMLAIAGMFIAYRFVEPAPPSVIRMATGDPAQSYHRNGRKYAELLAASGVTVELVPTSGSVENLQKLTDGDVDIGLAQSGIDAADPGTLQSLGSIYLEPLWIFLGPRLEPTTLADLQGYRVATGPERSGSQELAALLLGANGVADDTLMAMPTDDAVAALRAGTVDALMLVTAPTTDFITELVADADIRLFDMSRSDAHARLFPFLTALTLPEGVLDLSENLPDRPIRMVAPAANLVVRDDFHPALVDLVLVAARDVNGGPGVLHEAGTFPNPDFASLSLNAEAERHYRFGPPLLMRHLPFWAATLIDRLKIMLVPLIGLLLPLAKALPPLYRWRTRKRIYRWYEELRAVDPDLSEPESLHAASRRLKDLDRIETEVAQINVPLSYADELYDLRRHIELVRTKLLGHLG